MKIQVWQDRGKNPRIDGKNGGQFNRCLFREDSRGERYDTIEVYLEDPHVESVASQALSALPSEARERAILQALKNIPKDSAEKILDRFEDDG
jgi:hypothetical protein